MINASRHLIMSFSRSSTTPLKCFHTGVVCVSEFDTGIVEFERNKKAYRGYNQNRLPSWLQSLDYMSKNEIKRFYSEFESIVDDMVTMKCTKDLDIGNERTKELMEYALPWAPVCAVQFLMTNKFYAKKRKETGKLLPNEDEHTKLSFKLAWILEMLAKTFFMVDDIMDGAESRQNLPSWHTVPGVGLHGVNDLCVLNNGGIQLLNKYFSQESFFPQLLSYIMKSMLMTGFAENELHLMTMEVMSRQNVLYSETHLNRVKQLLNTSIFPNMPVLVGMLFNGINDPSHIATAAELGNEVATYAVVVDDWIDCYGGHVVNERNGRDIMDGKLTWLLYTAWRLGNEEQRRRLMTIYGKNDLASVEEVKNIYDDLKIREIVYEISEEKGRAFELRISQLPQDTFPSIVWHNLLEYFRKVLRGTVARA